MGLKIALIFILFFVCYLGLIPAYSKYCRGSQLTLSLMNCFAGGLFLAMAFMHILPEAVEQYYGVMTGAEDAHAGHGHRLLQAPTTAAANSTIAIAAKEEAHVDRHGIFPLPYLLFFSGYCLVLLVDRVFAGEYGHSHAHETPDDYQNEDDKVKAFGDNEKQNSKGAANSGHDQARILKVEDFQVDNLSPI
jgi:zinc transporter ZupT